MKALSRCVLGTFLFCALTGGSAMALGPVDAEVDLIYWSNEFETDIGNAKTSTDGDAPGIRAELWMQRYGLRAAQFTSDSDDFGSEVSDTTSVDFLWQAFRPVENNFLAVGVGWQQMDLDGIGLDGSTSGMRMTLEGRVGLRRMLYAYGQGAYLPSLDDTDAANVPAAGFENLDGYEYELGVGWTFSPFLHMKAGYRLQNIGFTATGFNAALSEGSGDGASGTGGSGGMPINFGTNPGTAAAPPVPTPNATFDGSGTVETGGFFVGVGIHF